MDSDSIPPPKAPPAYIRRGGGGSYRHHALSPSRRSLQAAAPSKPPPPQAPLSPSPRAVVALAPSFSTSLQSSLNLHPSRRAVGLVDRFLAGLRRSPAGRQDLHRHHAVVLPGFRKIYTDIFRWNEEVPVYIDPYARPITEVPPLAGLRQGLLHGSCSWDNTSPRD